MNVPSLGIANRHRYSLMPEPQLKRLADLVVAKLKQVFSGGIDGLSVKANQQRDAARTLHVLDFEQTEENRKLAEYFIGNAAKPEVSIIDYITDHQATLDNIKNPSFLGQFKNHLDRRRSYFDNDLSLGNLAKSIEFHYEPLSTEKWKVKHRTKGDIMDSVSISDEFYQFLFILLANAIPAWHRKRQALDCKVKVLIHR